MPKDIAHRRRRIFGGPEADDSEGAYVFGICIGQNEEIREGFLGLQEGGGGWAIVRGRIRDH